MIIGIVGNEGGKFTPETEERARQAIRELIKDLGPLDAVCSGACHLGGIDVWAVEEARKLDLQTIEYPPKVQSWEEGYKPRNIQIAKTSDIVVCICVRDLPEGYSGYRFSTCYHHRDEECVENHVKSGGCWTTQYARKLKKETKLIVID